ncbi:Similar to LRRC74A: Leucine-rich repeat-containing protein 74A (Homo sapiens) [Cotesia congregata]|uniref:Similar to LRRC74A: Leucine-rich repeat-containing protein 74A (Homo sapiens) n=1 Tax=Cotesia congregata TaxID=51543 RepID=A0A8J2HMC5_COTCN|nr:Similar to LRRC74A: Leucine-rich repeat-containing protein 74A (Homo sapiens) [Cotesia congregata]
MVYIKEHKSLDREDDDDQHEHPHDEAEDSSSYSSNPRPHSLLEYLLEETLSQVFSSANFQDTDQPSEIKSESNESLKTVITPQDSEFSDELQSENGSSINIPEDAGLRPGSWILFPQLPGDRDEGVIKFIELTKELNIPPLGQIPQMLNTNQIDLKSYGLDPRTMKIICEALNSNTTVKILNFQDNWLTADACYHLNDLLINNNIITEINLSGCRIGEAGSKELETGISSAESLQYLNVSRCDLGDEGLLYLSKGVYCSPSLKKVNFSNNNLSENCASTLQKMLIQTDNLDELNLSWNNLNSSKFWETFIIGLTANETLKYLIVNWNGLDGECVPYLTEYLSSDPNLLRLDLRDNSFTSVEKIAEALINNTKLEIVELGNNPVQAKEVFIFIQTLTRLTSTSRLKMIDLENIWADKEVLPLLDDLKTRLGLDVTLGGILSNYEIIGPDPRKIFLKRANFEAMKPKKKKLKRNFGQFVMSLQDLIISREAFKKSIKSAKIKLSESLITEISKAFEIGDDAIDLSILKQFYLKEYPEATELPPLIVPRKKRKIKKKSKKIK